MLPRVRHLLKSNSGLGTVEIVLIIAVLVGLALLFKNQIVQFVAGILGGVVDTGVNPTDIGNTPVN